MQKQIFKRLNRTMGHRLDKKKNTEVAPTNEKTSNAFFILFFGRQSFIDSC
jgi:hypothetical protein